MMSKYLIPILLCSHFLVFGQGNSFELQWGDIDKRDLIDEIIEIPDKSYIIQCFSIDNDSKRYASVSKINENGKIVKSYIFESDSSTAISTILYHTKENLIIALGSKSDNVSFTDLVTFICVWDLELNLISYKEYNLPADYHSVSLTQNAIKPDGNIVFGGVIYYELLTSGWGDFYLMECTPLGDTIRTSITPDEGPLVIKDFCINPDSISYTFSGYSMSLFSSIQLALVDSNLNVIEIITLPNPYIDNPLTFEWFTDTTFLMSCRLTTDGTMSSQEIYFMEHNREGEVFHDYMYINPDTVDVPFWDRGFSFLDRNSIFLGGNLHSNTFGAYNIPTKFVILNFNETLEVNWTRIYGGQTHHQMECILATSDGGCIVGGGKSDENIPGSPTNFYVLKLDAQGQISSNNYNEEKSITIFPNPGQNQLHIQSEIANFDFELFNSLGVMVLSVQNIHKTHSVNTNYLRKGIYFFQIKNKEKIIEKGKWVKY